MINGVLSDYRFGESPISTEGLQTMFKTLMSTAALTFCASTAYPATLTLTDVSAAWSGYTGNPSAVSVTDGVERDGIFWGTNRFGKQSGYTFDRAAVGTTHAPDTRFTLGTFTHDNQVVDRGINSANLDVSFTFYLGDDASKLITRTSQFVFTHVETPNVPTSGVCTNGKPSKPAGIQVGCEDRVVAVTNPTQSETFQIGDRQYVFDVTGFDMVDGFWTVENGTNAAPLTAQFTEAPAPVPVPAAMSLILAAIGALGSLKLWRGMGRFGDWFSAERGAGDGRNGWV